MSLPLPPSNPHQILPAAQTDQSRGIRRAQGNSLPTPRTYRMEDTTYRTLTTAATKLGDINAALQPGEIMGIMCSVDVRSTVASTVFVVYVDNATTPWGGTDLITATAPTGTYRMTHVSQSAGSGNTVNYPLAGVFPGSFRFLMPHRNSSNGVTRGVSVAQTITPAVYVARTSGTGTLQVSDFRMWVMVL